MRLNPTSRSLPIICLSACWLSPTHPDPRGETLQTLAKVLQAYVRSGDRWGVFISWTAMPQHPEPPMQRSAHDTRLFDQGLDGLGMIFSHPHTTVLRLTSLPSDYPSAYDLPETANTAEFEKRGWTYTEMSWGVS